MIFDLPALRSVTRRDHAIKGPLLAGNTNRDLRQGCQVLKADEHAVRVHATMCSPRMQLTLWIMNVYVLGHATSFMLKDWTEILK